MSERIAVWTIGFTFLIFAGGVYLGFRYEREGDKGVSGACIIRLGSSRAIIYSYYSTLSPSALHCLMKAWVYIYIPPLVNILHVLSSTPDLLSITHTCITSYPPQTIRPLHHLRTVSSMRITVARGTCILRTKNQVMRSLATMATQTTLTLEISQNTPRHNTSSKTCA